MECIHQLINFILSYVRLVFQWNKLIFLSINIEDSYCGWWLMQWVDQQTTYNNKRINQWINKRKVYFSFVGEIDWLIVELFAASSIENQDFQITEWTVIDFDSRQTQSINSIQFHPSINFNFFKSLFLFN